MLLKMQHLQLNDEFFVTEQAAKEGIVITNTSKTGPIRQLPYQRQKNMTGIKFLKELIGSIGLALHRLWVVSSRRYVWRLARQPNSMELKYPVI